MDFQAVLEAVRALPIDDRARLVDLIQEEMETQDVDSELTPEQMQELDRRIADHKAHPERAIPWEEFEARINKHIEELSE